jgi:hypothetical protein
MGTLGGLREYLHVSSHTFPHSDDVALRAFV